MDNFIKTDNNIMIDLNWIKEIKSIEECYTLKLNIDNKNEYKVCKNNTESYNKLNHKFKFSKK